MDFKKGLDAKWCYNFHIFNYIRVLKSRACLDLLPWGGQSCHKKTSPYPLWQLHRFKVIHFLDLLLGGGRFGIIKTTGQSIAADPLSKRSATIGWRVAYKNILAENASQIAGKGTSQAGVALGFSRRGGGLASSTGVGG